MPAASRFASYRFSSMIESGRSDERLTPFARTLYHPHLSPAANEAHHEFQVRSYAPAVLS